MLLMLLALVGLSQEILWASEGPRSLSRAEEGEGQGPGRKYRNNVPCPSQGSTAAGKRAFLPFTSCLSLAKLNNSTGPRSVPGLL